MVRYSRFRSDVNYSQIGVCPHTHSPMPRRYCLSLSMKPIAAKQGKGKLQIDVDIPDRVADIQTAKLKLLTIKTER
jgi:hypothetical protein